MEDKYSRKGLNVGYVDRTRIKYVSAAGRITRNGAQKNEMENC